MATETFNFVSRNVPVITAPDTRITEIFHAPNGLRLFRFTTTKKNRTAAKQSITKAKRSIRNQGGIPADSIHIPQRDINIQNIEKIEARIADKRAILINQRRNVFKDDEVRAKFLKQFRKQRFTVTIEGIIKNTALEPGEHYNNIPGVSKPVVTVGISTTGQKIRRYVFPVVETPIGLPDLVDRLLDAVARLFYIEDPYVVSIFSEQETKSFNPNTQRVNLTKNLARPDVQDVSTDNTRCAIDAVVNAFRKCYHKNRHDPITRAKVNEFFQAIRPLDDGYTLHEIRDACIHFNANYFIGYDAFATPIVKYRNPTKNARPGLAVYAIDGHAYVLPHKSGDRLFDSKFGPKNFEIPSKKTFAIYDNNLNHYRQQIEEAADKDRFTDEHPTLDDILADEVTHWYISDAKHVHVLFKAVVDQGIIPRITNFNKESHTVQGFVVNEKYVRHSPMAIEGWRISRINNQEYKGKSAYALSLDLLETCGFEPSTLSPGAAKIFRQIASHTGYYMHQFYTDEKFLEQKDELFGIDIRQAFPSALRFPMPQFTIMDSPKRFSYNVSANGFYYVINNGDKWPLFGNNQWYYGKLILRLLEDGEVSPNDIKYELVPSKTLQPTAFVEWMEVMRDIPNDSFKDISVGMIGFMRTAAKRSDFHTTAVFTDKDEALSYEKYTDAKIYTVPLTHQAGYIEITEENQNNFVWIGHRSSANRDDISLKNHLPAHTAIISICALKCYEIARDVIAIPNWRDAVAAVCVDNVSIVKKYMHKRRFAPKSMTKMGDAYHYDDIKHITNRGPNIKHVYVPPILQNYYTLPRNEWGVTKPTKVAKYLSSALFSSAAGTGKTHLAKEIIRHYKENVLVAAPTHLVAEAMIADGIPAVTAHKAFGVGSAPMWTKDTQVVIIDECFMLTNDIMILLCQYKYKYPNTRLFMFGDEAQNEPPDGSPQIPANHPVWHWLANNNMIVSDKNYRILNATGKDKELAEFLDRYRKSILSRTPIDIPYDMFQRTEEHIGLSIAPTNVLVDAINAMHPKMQKGTPVIMTKNTSEYCNGQMFYVDDITKTTLVNRRTKEMITISPFNMKDAKKCYAATCHRLQGQTLKEPHTVVSPDKALSIFGHKWLYTALSRTDSYNNLFIKI